MKLLYDLSTTQPNWSGASHGGGKYAIVVFFELLKRDVPMECVYDARLPLREDVLKAIDDNGIVMHDLSKNSLDEIVDNRGIDTFFRPSSEAPPVIKKLTRSIITVHGLRSLEMPRDWWLLKYKLTAYQRFRNLITLMFDGWWKQKMLMRVRKTLLRKDLEYVFVSEHTKYSCLSNVPELDPKKMVVFYSPSTSTERDDIEPYSEECKYILLVSGNRGEKNALRVIAAMDELFSERHDIGNIKILTTGTDGTEYYFKIKNKDKFRFLGYVDEHTLESLYKGAYLFVYPSINEGFGYPPMEAMRYGVPVAASPVSSISEVCGDAALYFNPFDCREIKGRILRLLMDSACREDYSARGLKRFEYITARQKSDLTALVDFIIGDHKKSLS